MATVVGDALEIQTALKRVLKSASSLDGVARGLNEVARTLDRREAHFCIFAKNCDEPSYRNLVKALCHEHKIPIIEVDDKAELGELVGQCKYDKEGKARKVVGCSCAVVKNYSRDDLAVVEALEFIEKNFKKADEK